MSYESKADKQYKKFKQLVEKHRKHKNPLKVAAARKRTLFHIPKEEAEE